jgi:hypothetical protein
LGLNCIWIENTCYDVKDSCEAITINKTICETNGAAKSGESTLNCFWLLGNTSTDITTDICKNKV